jgi:hypothetical protein
MTEQTRTVTAEVIIKLFGKHPDLQYPAESWYFHPNQQEKELLEFLLGDQLLAEENGLGWTIEYQVALAICLEELAKQSPKFFNQFLPGLRTLKTKFEKMGRKRIKVSPDEQKHQGYSILKECLDNLAAKLQGQTLTITPFNEEDKQQIRKKIFLSTLIREKGGRKGKYSYYVPTEMLQKLLDINFQEMKLNPAQKPEFL